MKCKCIKETCFKDSSNVNVFNVGENYDFEMNSSLFFGSISKPYRIKTICDNRKMDYLIDEDQFNNWFSTSAIRDEILEKLLSTEDI